MYTLREASPEFEDLRERAKDALRAVLDGLQYRGNQKKVSVGTVLYQDKRFVGKLFIIVEGSLAYCRNDQELFYFEQGDLIGLEQALIGDQGILRGEFAVIVREFDSERFLAWIRSSTDLSRAWDTYLVLQMALFRILTIQSVENGKTPSKPEIRSYSPGEVIIEQGASGLEVHTIVDGRVDVVRDGEVISVLSEGQAFGVVSVLGGLPQVVTIRAADFCTTMALWKDDFEAVMRTDPVSAFRLLQDTSLTIDALMRGDKKPLKQVL